MQLILGLLTILLAICLGNLVTEEPIVRGVGDTACLGVTKANVRCVSRTEFIMAFQDPKVDPPIKCPAGMVCSDEASICSSTHEPLCTNEVAGAQGVCNMCPPNKLYNPICVSDIEYGFCIKGVIQEKLVYRCKPPNIYCKATFDKARPPRLTSICTSNSENLDCPVGFAEKRNKTTPDGKPKPRNFIQGLVDSLIKASKQVEVKPDFVPIRVTNKN